MNDYGEIFGAEYTKGRIRNLVFTLNNWTQDELDKLLNFEHASYVICGKEIGRKRKTPHIQGYMELEKQLSFSTIKSEFPRMYIAKRRGTV